MKSIYVKEHYTFQRPQKKKKKGNFVYDTDAESRRYKKKTLQGGKLKRYPNTGI